MTKRSSPLLLGAHTSAAGGAHNALYEGRDIGATTVQFFTSNQKQWNGRTISEADLTAWEKALAETGMSHLMSHDSYLINLGSPSEEILAKSRKAFQEEIKRCHLLQVTYLNFHPGAATGSSEEECLDKIAESLLEIEPLVHQGSTRLLLEATAGQGTSVGYKFEHLAHIIQKVGKKIPLGVCIDTCHIFAAGYDLRTADACKKMLAAFDEVVGLEHLYAFHLNDSMKDLGSRVDRHAPLGKGCIGIEAFKFLMTHPKTRSLPKYLETPDGPPLWKEEIALLKTFAQE
jgi:deoxyribonuclease-4